MTPERRAHLEELKAVRTAWGPIIAQQDARISHENREMEKLLSERAREIKAVQSKWKVASNG